LLSDKKLAQKALSLHKLILNHINESVNRKTEDFKTLRKGLGYSLSVVVQAIPEAGFKFLDELILNEDNDIRWILKENLKKNRLTKNYPKKVQILSKKLS
jgi:dethiobiotin synthetase